MYNQVIAMVQMPNFYQFSESEKNDYKFNQIAHNLQRLSIEGTGFLGPMFISHIINSISRNKVVRGVTHGSRQGWEPFIFSLMFDAHFTGTDISPTCEFFPNMFTRDFHDLNPEECSCYDFVYSNAWDQAINPMKAIRTWLLTTKDDGFLVLRAKEPGLEWINGRPELIVDETDPFNATLSELEVMIQQHNPDIVLSFYTILEENWHHLNDSIAHPYSYLVIHKRSQHNFIDECDISKATLDASNFVSSSKFPRSPLLPSRDLTNNIRCYKSVCHLIAFTLSYPDFIAINYMNQIRNLLRNSLPGYDHSLVASQVQWNDVVPDLMIQNHEARTIAHQEYHPRIRENLKSNHAGTDSVQIF